MLLWAKLLGLTWNILIIYIRVILPRDAILGKHGKSRKDEIVGVGGSCFEFVI